MSKTLLSMIAATALAGAALPAAAQDFHHHHGPRHSPPIVAPGHGLSSAARTVEARRAEINGRIDRGIRTGLLTRNEAASLQAQNREIGRLAERYGAGGLNGWERTDLDRRQDQLSFRVTAQLRDGERAGPRHGR